MRILVTGTSGQVVTALLAAAQARQDIDVLAIGRPALDLENPVGIDKVFAKAKPDIVINAAAYTAVDLAEQEPKRALAVNGAAAGAVAAAAEAVGVPIIQISTDYVFDGSKIGPYVETDIVGPIGTYGHSKLAGEAAVSSMTENHAILRTSWVYAPMGKNFVRTMLRLAETRDEVAVVADQFGCPSYAPDIADALIKVAANLVAQENSELRGIFHLAGTGQTDWASLAEAVFAESRVFGGPSASVRRIATSEYPTPARRPANSVLDCSKLRQVHGVAMPDWRDALKRCVAQLMTKEASQA